MMTDLGPGRWIYISRRLTRNIIDEQMAEAEALSGEVMLGAGGAQLKVHRQPPDLENRFTLALEASKAVKRETGSLNESKPYVRDILDMHPCAFDIYQGWAEGSNHRIAGFCSSTWVDGIGRVFVALFGSLSNWEGYSEEDNATTGWWPSSAPGLYHLLDRTREPNDDQINPAALREDEQEDLSDDRRCGVAERIFSTMTLPRGERLEFLAETFIEQRDLHLGAEDDPPYDLVIVGAPIWVRKRRTRESLSLPNPLEAAIPDVAPVSASTHWWDRFRPTRLARRGD